MARPPARTAAIALAITLAIQVFTSLAATATSVLAPEIGRDLGFAPKLVGVFVGLMYAGGMSASLASGGFIERYGAIRVSQVCVLFCAAGLGMVVAYATGPAVLLPMLFAGALSSSAWATGRSRRRRRRFSRARRPRRGWR